MVGAISQVPLLPRSVQERGLAVSWPRAPHPPELGLACAPNSTAYPSAGVETSNRGCFLPCGWGHRPASWPLYGQAQPPAPTLRFLRAPRREHDIADSHPGPKVLGQDAKHSMLRRPLPGCLRPAVGMQVSGCSHPSPAWASGWRHKFYQTWRRVSTSTPNFNQ